MGRKRGSFSFRSGYRPSLTLAALLSSNGDDFRLRISGQHLYDEQDHANWMTEQSFWLQLENESPAVTLSKDLVSIDMRLYGVTNTRRLCCSA